MYNNNVYTVYTSRDKSTLLLQMLAQAILYDLNRNDPNKAKEIFRSGNSHKNGLEK